MTELTKNDLVKLLSSGPRHVHLVGIGGSGMSGLAKLLSQNGHQVSGSDWADDSSMDGLRKIGIQCFHGHAAEHLKDVDFVSHSSAISSNNPEWVEAERRGIPVVRRARTLSAIMDSKDSIIVSGTHGKTTTTSMIAHILKTAGHQPSFFVGANSPALGSQAEIGQGKEFVVEADESDGSMSEFDPVDLVILNIEAEHLDFYENLEAIQRAFLEIGNKATGTVVYCEDDDGARKVGSQLSKKRTYSIQDPKACFYAQNIVDASNETSFDVIQESRNLGRITLQIPGLHNVSNALAALAVALPRGVDFQKAAAALRSYSGARRRFEKLYESDSFLIVDDYAHHPSEIRATLQAAEQKRRKRIVTAFQPHRFTRTRALGSEFGDSFHKADRIFIADVYAASETPIAGVTGQLIADGILKIQSRDPRSVTYEPNLWVLKEMLGSEIQDQDLVLIMGAGNISQIGAVLAGEMKVYEEIRKRVSSQTVVHRYESMAKRTTMRTGGFAKLWVEPACEEDLAEILQYCHSMRQQAMNALERSFYEVSIIGRGSNLLVRDAGISGVTIHLSGEIFRQIQFDSEQVVAGAGARLKQVVMEARKNEITDLEFLEGIPGSVGGALSMNAGAMGNSIFDRVDRVRLMDMEGKIHEKNPADMGVGYRRCEGMRGFVALSATLKGRKGKPDEISARLKEFENKRWSTQPAAASAGCIFKNPAQVPAGKLIDELGLKGLKFGRASVSTEHGNFIVNHGGATATEVLSLISMIKDRVRKERGIELETEVIIFGDERW